MRIHLARTLPDSLRATPVAAAVIAALQTAALSAHAAQTAPQELPKISVGAQTEDEDYKSDASASAKYAQPLRDTPQTITVIPQAVIKERSATTLRDVLRNSPGITFQAGEGGGGLPGDQNFTMRGFSARNSLFIDGVRDTGAYTRDPFNLERVEVIKGPTGAIAGRSATSGAVNQISKTPHLEASQDYSLGYGSDGYRRVTGDLNMPVGERAALRLNAMYHDAEASNRDVVENQRWGVAPSFALNLGESTRFTLSYLYLEEDNVPDYGLPWGVVEQTTAANPAHNGVFPTGAYNAGVDRSVFYGLKNYDYEDAQSQAATARIDHDFSGAFSLRNVTRYLDTERDSAITAPRPPNRQLHRRTMGAENVANLTDLTFRVATGAIAHTLVTGVELSRETTENRNSADRLNQPIIADFFAPDPNLAPLGPLPANSGDPGETQTDTLALYVFDTIALNERWQIAAGLRWDDADVEFEQREYETGALIADVSKSEEDVTWHSALIFKPVETASVYVAYGTGFDPTVDAGAVGPGLSADPTDANNASFDPEESSNLELGAKWDVLDERVSLNAALFRTEKSNIRTRDARGEPFVLSGEQRVQGVELSLTGAVTSAWSVFSGVVWLDSEYERSASAIEEGEELLLTPELSFNAWTTYALPIGLTLGAGVQYTDDVVRSRSEARGTLTVPDFWLLDAMASYAINDSVSLQLNATNLADEDYVDRFGGGHYIPGPGRTVSLTANFTF